MATFIGTIIIVTLCCIAMGVGLLFTGKPLSGGCGRKLPLKLRCFGCPKRRALREQIKARKGEPG